MNNLTREDFELLEELINEEIKEYLESGYYSICSDFIIQMRELLQKLGLKEIYNFNEYN